MNRSIVDELHDELGSSSDERNRVQTHHDSCRHYVCAARRVIERRDALILAAIVNTSVPAGKLNDERSLILAAVKRAMGL